MAVQFSKFIIDKLIATDASQFTEASIPDMSLYDDQCTHWVANLFLNSLFSGYKYPYSAYFYNFLRRSQHAFAEYAIARDMSLRYISEGSQSPQGYAAALFHWEIFLGQSWHANKILQTAVKLGKLYEKGDQSTEEKLNKLYTRMKHVESRIENGQLPEGATVPVWLTNSGLQSLDTSMTYVEMAEAQKKLSEWASILQNPKSAAGPS